jgi:hypothetical protein
MTTNEDQEKKYEYLKHRIGSLENQVADLLVIMKFHKLDKIDIKYRKAFPESGRIELIENDQNGPSFYSYSDFPKSGDEDLSRISSCGLEKEYRKIDLPTNPKVYEDAKERVQARIKNLPELESQHKKSLELDRIADEIRDQWLKKFKPKSLEAF